VTTLTVLTNNNAPDLQKRICFGGRPPPGRRSRSSTRGRPAPPTCPPRPQCFIGITDTSIAVAGFFPVSFFRLRRFLASKASLVLGAGTVWTQRFGAMGRRMQAGSAAGRRTRPSATHVTDLPRIHRQQGARSFWGMGETVPASAHILLQSGHVDGKKSSAAQPGAVQCSPTWEHQKKKE